MKQAVEAALSALYKLPVASHLLVALSQKYLNIHRNFNYDQDSNGERWIVQALARHGLLSTCFDVGANGGDWAALVANENPQAVVHCFEVSPPTYRQLAGRFPDNSRLILNPVGLSDQNGKVEVQHCKDNTGLSSIVEVVSSKNNETIASRVVRGADYCAEHGIGRIDFLKLDVEGAEDLVLSGFGDLLLPGSIPVVQFEYGMANIPRKTLLREFHQTFESRGYQVGKLFPRSVRFREYRFEDEDFRGPNFVAASPEVAKLLGAS